MDRRRLDRARERSGWKLLPLFFGALLYIAALAYGGYYLSGSPVVGGAIALAAIVVIFVFYGVYPGAAVRPARASPLALAEDPELFQITGRLAGAAGIALPQMLATTENGLNSYAVGSRSSSRIIVTDGLLDLSSPELDAAIAHEIVHIAAGDTAIDRLAFALTGWVLLPLNLVLNGVYQIESGIRTLAAQASNVGNGLGAWLAWPLWVVAAVLLFAMALVLVVVALPARLIDMLVFRSRERRADSLVASAVSSQAVIGALRTAAQMPGFFRASRVAGKITQVRNRPIQRWWREPYSTSPLVARRIAYLRWNVAKVEPPAEGERPLASGPAFGTPVGGPGPAPTAGPGAATATVAGPQAAPRVALKTEPIRRRRKLMLYQKILYLLAGAILGVAGTAAGFVYVDKNSDDNQSVAVIDTPTDVPTVTRTPTRAPSATATTPRSPSPTPSRTPTPVAAKFKAGDAVTLTNGTGNCLQTFADHTFKADKLACLPDGTEAKIKAGPWRVTDTEGEYTWWQLDSGAYIIEDWMR